MTLLFGVFKIKRILPASKLRLPDGAGRVAPAQEIEVAALRRLVDDSSVASFTLASFHPKWKDCGIILLDM